MDERTDSSALAFDVLFRRHSGYIFALGIGFLVGEFPMLIRELVSVQDVRGTSGSPSMSADV